MLTDIFVSISIFESLIFDKAQYCWAVLKSSTGLNLGLIWSSIIWREGQLIWFHMSSNVSTPPFQISAECADGQGKVGAYILFSVQGEHSKHSVECLTIKHYI